MDAASVRQCWQSHQKWQLDCARCFLLLSAPGQFCEGCDDQGRGRGHCRSLGLSVLSGQFHGNPQTLPVTCCFSDVITNLFWRHAQGTREDVAPTSPLVHLRYTSPWAQTSAAWWRWLVLGGPRFRTTRESCTLASSEPKAKRSPSLLKRKSERFKRVIFCLT